MRTECLIQGGPGTSFDVRLRFLQVIESDSWKDTVERDVSLADCRLGDLLARPQCTEFGFPALQGSLEVTARLGLRRGAVSGGG